MVSFDLTNKSSGEMQKDVVVLRINRAVIDKFN